MSIPKPMPVVDHLSAPFWDACRQEKLKVQTCSACGRHRFPPGPVCHACGSDQYTWTESTGRGRVYSWIVVRHPIPAEIFAADVPYVVALVELDEQVRMPSNIVGCAPEAVTAGMPLQVCFRKVSDTITLPQFRPAA